MSRKQIDFLMTPFVDSNGDPLAAGTVDWYVAGSSTPLNVYEDPSGGLGETTTLLDSNGVALRYSDGTTSYKCVVKNSAGATLYTYDYLDYDAVGSLGAYYLKAGDTLTGPMDVNGNNLTNAGDIEIGSSNNALIVEHAGTAAQHTNDMIILCNTSGQFSLRADTSLQFFDDGVEVMSVGSTGNLTLVSGDISLTAGDIGLTAGDIERTTGNFIITSKAGTLTLQSNDTDAVQIDVSQNLVLPSGSLTLTTGSATLSNGNLILNVGDVRCDDIEAYTNNGIKFAYNAAGYWDVSSTHASQAINMNSKRIIGVADPSDNQDAATKKWADDNKLDLGGGTLTGGLIVSSGDIAADTFKGYTTATNTIVSHATTGWVLSASGLIALDCSSKRIQSVANPVNSQDAATKAWTDTNKLDLTGGTLTGDVVMNGALMRSNEYQSYSDSGVRLVRNASGWWEMYGSDANNALNMTSKRINSVKDPAAAQDAATKNYVDNSHTTNVTNLTLSGASDSTNVALSTDMSICHISITYKLDATGGGNTYVGGGTYVMESSYNIRGCWHANRSDADGIDAGAVAVTPLSTSTPVLECQTGTSAYPISMSRTSNTIYFTSGAGVVDSFSAFITVAYTYQT